MMGISNNIKQLAFNWLCAVTDFFGIFFVVCWVFYEPHDESLEDAFLLIHNVWSYKLYITIIPGVVFPAFILYIVFVWNTFTEDTTYEDITTTGKIIRGICTFIGCTFMLPAGCIAGAVSFEILCWTLTAGLFFVMGNKRLPGFHKLSVEFYTDLLKFINAATRDRVGLEYAGCSSFTKHQDKMMRLASVNMTLAKKYQWMTYEFRQYMDRHRDSDQYMGITFSGLRTNTTNRKGEFKRHFWKYYGDLHRDFWHGAKREYKEWKRDRTWKTCNELFIHSLLVVISTSLTFLFGPIYLISKMVHLAFPWFIVLYLYLKWDVVIWTSSHIDVFQMVMITIYLVLCTILAVLLYLNGKEQHLMYHIMPSRSSLPNVGSGVHNKNEEMMTRIRNMHYELSVVPIQKAMLQSHFGPDIGEIIIMYLDAFEIEKQEQTI